MKRAHLVIPAVVLAAALGAACAPSPEPAGDPPVTTEEAGTSPVTAVAEIQPKSGSAVGGTATFTSDGGQVTLRLELTGLPGGQHAVHLHQLGDCSADDGSSAGGHWNPTAAEHGKWGEGSFHLGDIGNVEAGEDGTASKTMVSERWSIGTGGTNDILERAVIVHAGVDDFVTQPTGAAGGRIGCGVIE